MLLCWQPTEQQPGGETIQRLASHDAVKPEPGADATGWDEYIVFPLGHAARVKTIIIKLVLFCTVATHTLLLQASLARATVAERCI